MNAKMLVPLALLAACCAPAATPAPPTAHKMPAETPPTPETAPVKPTEPAKPTPSPTAAVGPAPSTTPVAPPMTSTSPEAPMPQEQNLYAISASALDGSDAKLSQYKGKVALVVNVASECGFTKQYAGLEKLWAEYKDKGLVVIGFPSNEFGGQEPGDATAIRTFCTKNYGVTFPLMSKVVTKKGAGQSQAYAYLVDATGQQPSWNFCKYLVGKDGKAVKFWKSQTAPESKDLRDAIDAALAAK